jgi:hypothetical protein
VCTHPRICDEFLNVLYGRTQIELQTIHDHGDIKTSKDSRKNFATFIQEGRVRHFDQIKYITFNYHDHSDLDEDSDVDSSRNGQLSEAIQFLADCGCRLRAFSLMIELSGTNDKYPDSSSWRTKLLGGTSMTDALCALHVSDSIVIVLCDDWFMNKGVKLITEMVKEIVTIKRWDCWQSRARIDEYDNRKYWTWSLMPTEL